MEQLQRAGLRLRRRVRRHHAGSPLSNRCQHDHNTVEREAGARSICDIRAQTAYRHHRLGQMTSVATVRLAEHSSAGCNLPRKMGVNVGSYDKQSGRMLVQSLLKPSPSRTLHRHAARIAP
jgi:hypothetical protein